MVILFVIMLVFILNKNIINYSVEIFIKGVGYSNIIMMCLIYLFVGVFFVVVGVIGGVDVVVNVGLLFILLVLLLLGLFLIVVVVLIVMGILMGIIGVIGLIVYVVV